MKHKAPVSVQLMGDDQADVIQYRRKLSALTGSVTAAILLGRIVYWARLKNYEPFYKFREPCKHTQYKPGDSWIEDLEFTAAEFDNALKVIGTKLKSGMSRKEVEATEYPIRLEGETDTDYMGRFAAALRGLVIYWTDNNRVTWYELNSDLLDKFTNSIYLDSRNCLKYLRASVYGTILKDRKLKVSEKVENVEIHSSDQTQRDDLQKEKEVVAPAPAPRPFDPFFHPVFLEVTHDPTPAPIHVPEPASAEPDDADFVIALHSEYFGSELAPTHQQAQAAVVTYTLPEVRAALEDALAEKRKDAAKVIRWSYVNAILERRYQQQLDRTFQSTPHENALGMRPHYQFASPADNLIYSHPLWLAYRATWKERTGDELPIPPLKVKQYADTARMLDSLNVTANEVTRLVERKLDAGKANYSFLYLPEHIGELRAEDALKNRPRDPDLTAAVGKVWKAAPGDFVNEISDVLTAINPAPSPQEVTAFGAWYATQPQFKSQAKPPTTADLIAKRLAEFRASRKAPAPASGAPAHERPQKYVPTAEELAERLRMSAAARAARQEGVPTP